MTSTSVLSDVYVGVNTACSEISSEYNVFVCVNLKHCTTCMSDLPFQWFSCILSSEMCLSSKQEDGTSHSWNLASLKTNVHLSYLIDYYIAEYQFLYKFIEINLGKTRRLLWSLWGCNDLWLGSCYSNCLCDGSCALGLRGRKLVCLSKSRPTLICPVPAWDIHDRLSKCLWFMGWVLLVSI